MEKKYVIYKYTSPSGKSYIGQTCDMIKRHNRHKSKNNSCPLFFKSVKKYGIENFIFEILCDNLSLDEANICEQFYIQEHQTLVPNGYNLSTGGLNREWSQEVKNKISKSSIGKTHSDYTKQQMSISRIGKVHNTKHNQSDYTKQQIRDKLNKPVVINGITYQSHKIAAEALGIKYTTLHWRLRHNKYPIDNN